MKKFFEDMEKATLGTLIIRYILTGYMCMCLQLSGCVNLKFCTFICWDSLVNSAAVAEYDGDMWSSAMQAGTLLFCSGDCPGVCTAWFWWHLHCAFSVCQLNIWVTPVFPGTTVSHNIRGHWAVIVSMSRKTKECKETAKTWFISV